MKRKFSTREIALVVLLAVAAVLYFRWNADGIGFGSAAEKSGKARDFGEPPLVRMDLLAQAVADFDGKGRNLFAYYTPPPPPPKPRPQPPPPPVRPKIVREVKPPPPPMRPRAQPPNFSYLGFLGPKNGKIGAFDGKDGVILAKKGDVIPDTLFKLVDFKHEAVLLEYMDDRFKGQTTELQLKGRQ